MKSFQELATKLNATVTQVQTIEFNINDNYAIEIYDKGKNTDYDVNLVLVKDGFRPVDSVTDIPNLDSVKKVIDEMLRVFSMDHNNTPKAIREAYNLSPTYHHWKKWGESLEIIFEPLDSMGAGIEVEPMKRI